MDEFQDQAPYPSVPPTVPGALPQYQPTTKWPTILGVIGIVFGILAALQAAWGILSIGLTRGLLMPEMQRQLDATRGWTIVSSLLTLVPAILLLVAGIGLAKRRRWGVSLSKVWAILKMLMALVLLVVGWHIQNETVDLALASGGQPNPLGASTVRAFMFIGVAIGLLWLWALPVFMLIWFSRAKIKAEIASWR